MPNIDVERGFAPLEIRIPIEDILYISSNCKNSTLAVYIALYTYADFKTHDCHPSYEGIRQRANVKSETTVSSALKELEAIGVITKTKRPPTKKGERQTTAYVIHRVPQNLGKEDEPNSKKWSQPTPKNGDKQAPVEQAPEETPSPEEAEASSSASPDGEKRRINKIAYSILVAWCKEAGLNPDTIAARRKEMAHATALAKVKVTPEEIPELYAWVHKLTWRKSPVTLALMENQLNAYRAWEAEQAKPSKKVFGDAFNNRRY